MLKKILDNYYKLENITHKIMNKGLKFCFIMCLIAGFILCTYLFDFSFPIFYYIGITLFKMSLIFATEFILCGFVADRIKKQIS